mgnify:CR=1 FL=1|jgi:hypothetical protein
MPKTLLDENIPKRLKYRLLDAGVNVLTVRDMKWLSIVFITTDKNIPYQHTIAQIDLAIVVLNVPNLKYEFLQPLLPQIITLVPNAEKGKIYILQL